MDQWSQWVYQIAPRYGVDPAAADAISRSTEWPGRGGVGDAGTSYGPFQLHVGGALPRGRGRKWAESRAGVDYAIRQMAAHGARGLRGQAAIRAISANFERPADVAREVRQSTAFYNAHPSGGGARPAVRRLAQAGAVVSPKQLPQAANNSALIGYLLGSVGSHDYISGLPALMAAQQQQQAPQTARTPVKRSVSLPKGLGAGSYSLGKVLMTSGADRPGVKTQPAILNFARQVAGIYGQPLHIGTGSNHSKITADGNVSDHWSGHAVDIPASGKALIRMGQDALIAAGMSPGKARRQRGGLYNVGGHQVIFNTHQGGDHTNHLHISAH